jgi:hypothetical protein
LDEILFKIVKHVQDIWISLITSKPATAFRKFGHQLGFGHNGTIVHNRVNAATHNNVPRRGE